MRYTRTDNQPQPVATSDLLNLYLLPNGNLQVSLSPGKWDEMNEIHQKSNSFEETWAELFEASRFIGNNWYPNQTFALSSATNICYGAIYDDREEQPDGGPADFEHIWAFEDYWKTDEFEELFEGRSVIFTAVPANQEPNEFYEETPFIKKMVDSYLETALWTEEFDAQTIFDFSPESRTKAEIECHKFTTDAEKEGVSMADLDPVIIGHDFWLSRNGHGSGFFDAEYLTEAWKMRLDEIAEKAGGCGLTVVDGQAYLEY